MAAKQHDTLCKSCNPHVPTTGSKNPYSHGYLGKKWTHEPRIWWNSRSSATAGASMKSSSCAITARWATSTSSTCTSQENLVPYIIYNIALEDRIMILPEKTWLTGWYGSVFYQLKFSLDRTAARCGQLFMSSPRHWVPRGLALLCPLGPKQLVAAWTPCCLQHVRNLRINAENTWQLFGPWTWTFLDYKMKKYVFNNPIVRC